MTRIFNQTPTAITYDSAGRVVGAQAYVDADLSDPVTAHTVSLGYLQLEVLADEAPPSTTVTPVTALATAEVALAEAAKALEHAEGVADPADN